MLGCGRSVILLLIINFLDLSFVSSSSSSSQSATRPRFHTSGGSDYNSEHEDVTTEPPSSSEHPDLNPCNYDMCVEQQHTCLELAEATGCLCPGLSNAFTPPSPPRLLNLTQLDGKGVVVRWCAPTSIVTRYNVWVRGNGKVKDKNIKVEERKRAAVLEDVEAGAHICVEAVNKGGVSAEVDQSCATFEPQNTDSGLALKLGIIGGVVGLILLLILALLLWRHKSRQKSTTRTETEGVL